MKKILMLTAAALAALMLLPLSAFAAKDGGALPFSDVKNGEWYYDGVKSVYESNLMRGTSADKFDPDGTLTRGMCAAILYRAAKEPAVKAAATFSDVDAGAYYADAVAWAESEGVVKGKTATEFDPDGEITRAEFSTMMYRYLDAEDLELPETRDGEPADADDIPDYAAEAVDALYDAEVVNGRENGEFDPDADITRAEAASVLDRFFARVTVRWTKFYRTYNETWDNYAWVTFDQSPDGGFYKDVDISDLTVGYIPDGLVLRPGSDAEYWPELGYSTRLFIVCDPDTNTEEGHIYPPCLTIHVREGDRETGYSDEALAISEEITVNGMAALMFDFFFDNEGEQYECTRLEFGDKNFTVYIQGMNVSGEDVLKVAESLTVIPAE